MRQDYNRRTRLAIQNGQCGQGASADKQDEGSTKVASPCGKPEDMGHLKSLLLDDA